MQSKITRKTEKENMTHTHTQKRRKNQSVETDPKITDDGISRPVH